MRIAMLLLLSALIGCSSSKVMDADAATKAVKAYLEIRKKGIQVETGRIGTGCVLVNNGQEVPMDLTPDSDIGMLVAERAGYVSVTPDGAAFWKADLTGPGKANVDIQKSAPASKGCDYQFTRFVLATRELTNVTRVVSDESNAEVEFTWKWNTTELGRAFREDGKLYAMLSPSQRENFSLHLYGGSPQLPIPVPPENFTDKDTLKFKRSAGGWQPNR